MVRALFLLSFAILFLVAFADHSADSTATADASAEGFFSPASPLARLGRVVSLAQVLNPNKYSLFPGDPDFTLSIWNTIEQDGYKLEHITSLGTHTGTHISAPCHFIEGPQFKCIDQLPPSAFVFGAALIDVTDRMANPHPHNANWYKVTWEDILAYERRVNQRIPQDSMVILYTGLGAKFGTPAYANTPFPGFTFDAVQNLFRQRKIKGTGSDTWGPDASNDEDFIASNTTYANGGVTIENMNNLVALKGRDFGDLLIGAPTKLKNGSGYQTNVLAFLH